MRTSRFAIIVSLLAIALSIALYLPTFANSWADDDIDYLNLGARMMAGEIGLWTALFHPHGEHVVAGFQALFFAYLHFVGIDAYAWRAGVALVHAASAVFLALLAWRYGKSVRAGIAAAVVYVGACGFSSFWVWFPSGASVPLMTALVTGSAALLAWRDHLTARRLIAGAAIVAALLTESSFAPMVLLPAILDEYERRREGRKGIGILSVWTLVTMIATAIMVAILSRRIGTPLSIHVARGLPRAAFLALVAPFRFLVPGIPIVARNATRMALLGCALGVAAGAAVLTLLTAWWRNGVPRLALVAALSLPGSLGVILLIGLGRWRNGFDVLYQTDRYFFPLLVPAALLAGAIAGTVSLDGWSRWTRALFITFLSIAALSEFALHRRAMLGPIPNVLFARHGARLESLVRLTKMLEDAGPIEIPGNDIWFTGVHNGRLSTAVLTEVLCTRCDRLRLVRPPVDAATAARLNAILDRWARSSGEAVPFLRVIEGRLVNTRLRWGVDFSKAAFDEQVTSGFYEWDGSRSRRWMSRWMSGRGELTFSIAPSNLELTLAAPVSDLRRRFGWTSMTVRATLVDEETGLSFPLGSVQILQDGAQRDSLSTTPFRTALGDGRPARLILECDRVWEPAQVYESTDHRAHSIQVIAAETEEPRS